MIHIFLIDFILARVIEFTERDLSVIRIKEIVGTAVIIILKQVPFHVEIGGVVIHV